MENSDIFQPEETFKFWGVYELNFRVFIQKKFPAQSISLLPENETCKTGLTFFLYFSKNIIWKFNDTTVINSLLCSSWGTLYFCKTKKSMLRQYFATALERELPTLFFFQKKKKKHKTQGLTKFAHSLLDHSISSLPGKRLNKTKLAVLLFVQHYCLHRELEMLPSEITAKFHLLGQE